MSISPLLLNPYIKTAVWAGDRLRKIYGEKSSFKIAEAWKLSAVPDKSSIISNDGFNGISLYEYLSKINSSSEVFRFPWLVKILDSDEPLSVQVHPGYFKQKNTSKTYEIKNEVWYVMHAEPGTNILCGIKQGINKKDILSALKNGTLVDIMNSIPAHPGLSLYIPAGTLHSLPGGITVAEIQDNCDITYRLFDFMRTDSDGNPRELHITQGIESINPDYSPVPVYHPLTGNITEIIAKSTSFTSYIIRCENSTVYLPESLAYTHILCIKGNGIISDITGNSSTVSFNSGDSILYTSDRSKLTLTGNTEIILTVR